MMTKIKLLPHNQDMVNRIETAMIFGKHKIFYTEATGLGKSFIFMYLVNKYFKDKKVLYICPKNYIWYNLNAYKEFDLIKDCVEMSCYADFNTIKDHHFGYDAIFIDEAHHLTTPIQGENILKVVDDTLISNPTAYVFGFTATPFMDDGTMIGDKYFDMSIVGMDLLEAIDAKILQKINYAVAIKEDIELSEEEQNMAIKLNVDTTKNMVSNIVHEYSNISHWLVYFSKIEELNDNLSYFEKYFPDYKVFVIHYEINDCEKILEEFDTYEGKAILASVSMVLEGVHPKSVEGILLYRNVGTFNTFIQIVGRLGIINPNTNPIIVDIYNSYTNFIHSNIISRKAVSEQTEYKRSIRDYLYINASSYKFIELSDAFYRYNKLHEYRGFTWSNDVELSVKLGKNKSYVRDHIVRCNETHEQIIDYVLDEDRTMIKEYRGVTWTSQVELSIKLGKKKYYVHHHLSRGKTCEQLIDMYLDNKPNEYRGITWVSDANLSRILGKCTSYVAHHVSKGYTREQIIDEVLDGGLNEYRGITWKYRIDLYRKLGITKSYAESYFKKGYTCEKLIDMILDTPRKIKMNCGEYRGITWVSDADLSRKLGKNTGYIHSRLKHGKTREQIIDDVLDNESITIKEYRGITWVSDADLSRKLGKSSSWVYYKKYMGKTYYQIIDEVLDTKPNEYRGITWVSNKDLSRKLGQSESYVRRQLSRGKTLEQLIDMYLDTKPNEYRGITWVSDTDLSRKLGKYDYYIHEHLKRGKTCEQLIDMYLDTKPNEYRGITWVSDHDLSRKLGKSKSYVASNICRDNAITREQLIDMYLDNKPNEYRGITWVNNRDLSRKLGQCNGYVQYHLSKGKTCEQIIDQVLDAKT